MKFHISNCPSARARIVAGVAVLATAAAASAQMTHWRVPSVNVTGTTSASSSLQGFFANSSGGQSHDARSFSATVSLGAVEWSNPLPPAPAGFEWQYRPGRSTQPPSTVTVTVSASFQGQLTLTVPADDTGAAAGMSATLSGFSFTAYVADVDTTINQSKSRNFDVAPGGSGVFSGQISTSIYGPLNYPGGNVFSIGTLSMQASGGGQEGDLVWELVPIPEPAGWALMSSLPLALWGISRRLRQPRRNA
jgi:hypothetical protein